MPKVKTHSGAKKRFKRTASGKFKFARVFKRSTDDIFSLTRTK